ncbi:MAG: aspartate aminotransferase family protein [Clostridia bacterium]|nr:aspartate aminotransferase family protein [Clostridia bacterium]
MNDQNILYTNLHSELPVVDHAKGVYVYDDKGNEYLDCAAGIAVVNIGHGVKEVIDAMQEQSEKVTFVYGGTFTSEARARLAKQVIDMAPEGMDKLFLCSGGSEAMESVIKIARQYHLECGNAGKSKVISRWQSYHGNTLGTLTIGGRPSWRAKYQNYLFNSPHIPACNCYRCPYHKEYPGCGVECARELERVIRYEGADTVSAFVLEPIIGTTAAAMIPPKEYFEEVRRICDKYNVLLAVDEVICGFGRTGKNFAVDHFGITPDLIGVAKGMGSGYTSAGGVIVHRKIVEALEKGTGVLTHSFTYSGNPLMCATASAVLKYIKDNGLVENSAKMGAYFLEQLKPLESLPYVGQVRGIGLMLGIEFVKDKVTKAPFADGFNFSAKLAAYCFKKGILVTGGVLGAADGVLGDAMQIAPPFIITEKEIDRVVDTLREGIIEIGKNL